MERVLLFSILFCGLFVSVAAMEVINMPTKNGIESFIVNIDKDFKDSKSMQQFFDDTYIKSKLDSGELIIPLINRIAQESKERFEEIAKMFLEWFDISHDIIAELFLSAIKKDSTEIIECFAKKRFQDSLTAQLGLSIAADNKDLNMTQLIIENFRMGGCLLCKARLVALNNQCVDIVELIDEFIDRFI